MVLEEKQLYLRGGSRAKIEPCLKMLEYTAASKNYSTPHALIHLINRISSAIDQRETTIGVFLDLSKAFDTLDHQILFTKLEHYGIRDVALQWIKSYFSCRQQFAQINQTCSSMQTIKCGVLQGSILDPLFFILYIDDLPKASKFC